MRTRWLLGAAALACSSAAFVACATDETSALPPSDGGGPIDASDGAAETSTPDAAPCADCAYFPEACSADSLCLSGPFAQGAPGGGIDSRTRIYAVRGRAPNDVWMAGALGALAHFDGASWTISDPGMQMTVQALWLRDSGEVAVATMVDLFTRGLADPDASAGGWSRISRPSAPPEFYGPDKVLKSTFAAQGSQWLWCAMSSEDAIIEGRSSGLWRLRRDPSGSFQIGIGIAPDICKFTFPCTQMTSIHGLSANELWAVGLSGATVRIRNADGDAPTVEPFNSQTLNALNGVWTAANGEAWSVGAQGTVRHYHGDALLWDVVTGIPTNVDLNAIWGTSLSDIWAVGNAGVVLHYDGTKWSRLPVAGLGQRRPDLTTVWTGAPGQVWIGGQGVLLSLGGHP